MLRRQKNLEEHSLANEWFLDTSGVNPWDEDVR